MARGTIVGMIWGALVSVAAAGALSLAVGGPGPREATMPDDMAETAAATVGSDAAPATGVAEAEAETIVEAPPEAVAEADAAEADGPSADAEVTALVDPQTPGRRPPPDAAVERVAPPAGTLAAPDRSDQPAADTAPPVAPQVGQADALSEPVAEAQDVGATTLRAPDAPVTPAPQAALPGLPAPDAVPDPSVAPAQPPAPPVPTVETALVPDPQEPSAPEPASPEDAPAEDGRVDAAPMQDPADEDVVRDEDARGGIVIGEPAVALTDRGGAVSTRLPRIGSAAEAEPEAAPSAAEDSPLLRYAAGGATAIPEDLPRLAVILIDDGSGPLGPDALRAFPFPVTFAIDPAHPDAAGVALAYRALGFEVMALAELPEGAAATDVEVTLASVLDSVPEAVAVLESPAAGLQESRDVSQQVAAFLVESGHGLVMQPRGLNTAQALVAREGVPSATLFRDIDGEGQDAGAIRRVLDSAAFRARQDGAVVMLGRLRADTVSALVLWGLQDRAAALALVPVSTVLREAASE